jgi:hypothetical protein
MFQNILYVSVFCCNKCFHIASCKCSIWMLHMFSHICYKCIFQMFHMFQTYVPSVLSGCCICCSGYTHMLKTYVLIVSHCFSMLQQVLLPMCSDSRASTRCTRRPSTTRRGPPWWSMQPAQHMCMHVMLPLALGHCICDLSLSHVVGVFLVFGHACCALSRIGVHARCPLSLACS